MRRATIRRGYAVAVGVALTVSLAGVRGQNPPGPIPPGPAAKASEQPAWAKQTEDSIRPLPLEAIPDDPPPHEGAMFEVSYRIQAPDILLVEVLEALPGRPITGEKLVLSDGTISLGWYGSVHVAGLTPAQAKVKIIHHLRPFLIDQTLGLIGFQDRPTPPGPKGPIPADPFPELPPEAMDDGLGEFGAMPPLPRKGIDPVQDPDAGEAKKEAVPDGKAVVKGTVFPDANVTAPLRAPKPVVAKAEAHPAIGLNSGRYVYVDPAESSRVFVEVTAFNSKIYYVVGDVGTPGRLPWTGNETVFDAIQYAGHLLPSADRHNIRLNRPARGEKPASSYKIDLDAIERGEKKANLQVIPGDRLIIERKDHFEPRP